MNICHLFELFLNLLIEAEFTTFIGAKRYSHSDAHITINGKKVYRNGYRTRKLNTALGTLTLRIPRTNSLPFIPSFIDKYKRNTASVNNLIQQAYINGISTTKINNLTKALGINHISKSQVSSITNKLNDQIAEFKLQSLQDKHYKAIYIDATYEKVRINNKVKFCAMVSVLGYNKDKKDIITVQAFDSESEDNYSQLIENLKQRGLKAPEIVVSDRASGLVNAVKHNWPNTLHQRCKVHFLRNIFQHLDNTAKKKLSKSLKRIYHTSDKTKALNRAKYLYYKYHKTYPKAMSVLKQGIIDTLEYTHLNSKDIRHRSIESSNPIEQINNEFKRRTKSIGAFTSLRACEKLYSLMVLNKLNLL